MTHILKLHQIYFIIPPMLLLGGVQLANGQITGPTNVLANSTHIYQFNNGGSYSPNWIISGGTLLSFWSSGTTYYVEAKWDGGMHNGTVVFTPTSNYLYVYIGSNTPSNPPNPTVQSTAPGSVTLQRTGTPPGGITWYWQSSASGISTSLGSGSTKTVTSGSVYYIRARNSSGTWSTGSGSVSFTVPPTYNFSDENYVHTTVPRVASTNISTLSNSNKIESITYFDGLGRPMQSIGIRAGGNSQDIVTHVGYDEFGRQDKEYLPFTATTNGGFYRTGAEASTNTFYDATRFNADFPGMTTSNINPYSEKHLEDSPLSRVLEQGAPGADWEVDESSDSDHTIKFGYDSNTATEVKMYNVTFTSTANNTYTPQLSGGTSNYPAKKLYKTVTKDENWTTGLYNTTEEFKDMQGRVILKRTYADADKNNDGDTNDSGETQAAHDTYYVYDDYGNLTYVLPPKVVHDSSISSTELSELCYQYKYDNKNRLVEKKIPGKGWEYLVYDKLDRPIYTQDELQRQSDKWLFTKFDAFGRVAYTGEMTWDISRTSLQGDTTGPGVLHETQTSSYIWIDGTKIYYTSSARPYSSKITDIHTINYYDNYTFDKVSGNSETSYGITPETNVKDLPTGSKVRVLGTNNWITTVTYYDKKSRPIYVYSFNDYLDTTDKIKSQLDFTGQVLETTTTHAKVGKSTITTVDSFTYDHMNRVISQKNKINSFAEETIVENSYDELGELTTKGVGGKTSNANRLQTVDYVYNVRGWLKQINDPANLGNDLFSFKINYNTVNHSGTVLYNGNISETEWKTANDNYLRWYKYTYDNLNRITQADYSSSNSIEVGWFNVFGITYDKNGNLLSDANKSISAVEYNHLNMPTKITVTGANAGVLDYKYSADGIKLQKKKTVGGNVTTTDYADNYVYENNVLKQFNHPEGYVEPDGSGYQYVYRLTDIWGNTRITFADDNNNGSVNSSEIRREQNYYPFGGLHKGYNNIVSANSNSVAQKYKYNGKELNDELGLNWYDFGWRNYDATIGRWMNIDPHAENYFTLSPYNSFANNPISFVDPDGRDLLFWQKNDKGKWEQVEFSQLSEETQKAVEAFAKTEEGFNFLADFANEGDKIGEVEFGETGKYAKHELSFGEFSNYGSAQASSKARHKKNDSKLTFEWTLNTAYNNDKKSDGIDAVSSNAITNGHEAFIHFAQYLDELIEAFDSGDMNKVSEMLKERRAIARDGGGRPEHNAYLDNKAEFKQMRTYLTQLKKVLNPASVNKALNAHNENLEKRRN